MSKGRFLDKFSLSGKVALITGGSRGIGRELALGLAEAGADVIIVARKQPDLEAVAEEISATGRTAMPVQANIRHLPDIDNLIEQAMSKFGRIDILVNNAAANPFFGSALDVEEKIWDIVMGMNIKSVFFLSQKITGLHE